VLLHGLGHHRRAWDPVLPTLTKMRDVVTVDLPGHGDSPPLPPGTVPDLRALLDALLQFFTEHGIDRPHVAGNSMGGRLALELAREGHVRSATALAPAGFWKNDLEYAYTRFMLRGIHQIGRTLRPAAPAITRSVLGRSLAFASVRGRPWLLNPQQALHDARALQACAHFHATLAGGTAYEPGPQPGPGVPITIAWGTRDLILPYWQARRARAMLPWARHERLPRCGHVPILDAPRRIATILLEGSHEDTPDNQRDWR
jgi:pimeloyl-ACP methyl ester carboxylesterase